MKKLSVILVVMAAFGLALGACGGDGGKKAVCVPIETCDPACEAPEICCGTTCQEMETCDPECEAPAYCNPCTGACEEPPAECDPECEAGYYCDDGVCKEQPVCDPACTDNEVCVWN